MIQKEEPKYPIGGYAPGNYMCYCSTCKIEFQGDKRASQCEPCAVAMTKEEPKQETVGKQFYESADKVITVNKQETLEEFIESQPYYGSCTTEYLEGIEVGAKWQAQRRYSEEEVKHIVSEALQSALVKVDLEQWFKQFKKK